MLIEQAQVNTVTLTPTAAQAVKELLIKRNLEGYALRVFVSGGGCSGFQYGMALEEKIRDQDFVHEFDGVDVVIDEISINYLQGATIDYVDNIMGSGFKIENPNAISTCGCGSSFQTKQNSAQKESSGGCSCN